MSPVDVAVIDSKGATFTVSVDTESKVSHIYGEIGGTFQSRKGSLQLKTIATNFTIVFGLSAI